MPTYRAYLTPDQWIITCDDRDLIRLERLVTDQATEMLLTEIVMGLLQGKRTDLRDLLAIYRAQYASAASHLALQAQAEPSRVLELELKGQWRTDQRLTPKGEEARKLYETFCARRNERDALNMKVK
ncbi:MAG: hypothetical protein KGL39_51280 [Patescibacteria group bacterium]|nr:hypothetical protein [Patescibacteria group bacterium]